MDNVNKECYLLKVYVLKDEREVPKVWSKFGVTIISLMNIDMNFHLEVMDDPIDFTKGNLDTTAEAER